MKDHPDAASQRNHVGIFLKDVVLSEDNLSIYAGVVDGIEHAIDGAKERRFSASRSTDECGDVMGRKVQCYVTQYLLVAVPDIEVSDGEDRGSGHGVKGM